MTTKMINSTLTKEKKKVSTSNKRNRSNTVQILKCKPKVEIKKAELIQLLGRFEAELQAKDIALATLKSEKVKLLFSIVQLGHVHYQTDPFIALFRNNEEIKDGILIRSNSMKNPFEIHLVQLIDQQKKQVQTLKIALENMEKQCLLLSEELENEKKDKIRLQALKNQLLIVEEEKSQLQNDLLNVKLHNEEVEQQLIQTIKLLEYEHERHKKFVILLLNERKIENKNHKEQLKQLLTDHMNNDKQREIKFKELELENQQNKQVLTEYITQLQNQIDLLVKEKNKQLLLNNSSTINEETNESISKTLTKRRSLTLTDTFSILQISSSINEASSSSSTLELTMKNDIHSPTNIPTSLTTKNNSNPSTKTKINSSSISTRIQQPLIVINSTPPASPKSQRKSVSNRSMSTVSQNSIIPNSRTLTTTNNATHNDSTVHSSKNTHQIFKRITSKRTNQTSFPSEHKTDDIQTLLETLRTVVENRIKSQTIAIDLSVSSNTNDLKTTSTSLNSDNAFFRTAEIGDADQLHKFLQLGCNPNIQMIDGNTCLHISTLHGHIECIHYLLQFGANPYIENKFGITSWNNLFQLDEIIELECLRKFVNHGQNLPPIDLMFNAIEHNHIKTYDYLLSILHEQLKTDSFSLSRLFRIALRSSNTHFLECLLTLITLQDFIQLIDLNTFISNECLTILSSFESEEDHSKTINLTVCICSSNVERRYSYGIGTISITINMSWLELEQSCSKIYLDHITQIDSPFDYEKSSLSYSTNNINTLTLGEIKWYYRDSPNDDSPMPYTVAREQNLIIIHLKGIDMNSMDSLAYNYFIPSQYLKNYILSIEQHMYVGVCGVAYLGKKALFEDLMKYLERPMSFPTSPKFRVIRFEFESVTSLDDCIDALIEQDFLRTSEWQTNNFEQYHSTKVLLYFSNIENSGGIDMINILLNSQSVSDICQKIIYSREDHPNLTITYYFPSYFHIFVTLSKRTSSTEIEIYKKFKWIQFKIDSAPWNGLLKRYLWRRMIDINVHENRSIDLELIKTLQWVTNIWQRYNECLPKHSLQDASLGPALFFDCPMEREAIFEWLQMKWNNIIAPIVREYSMNKSTQSKSKDSKAIASSLRANSYKTSGPYEAVACRALYVLLQRAVSRDCPLSEHEREQYLLEFIGNRVEGSSSLMISSATSSRAGTPQPSGNSDFMSIQLE